VIAILRRIRRKFRKAPPAPPAPPVPADLAGVLRELQRERESSTTPHEVNQRMNDLEYHAEREELLSYPVYAAVNLIGVCNARCRFCYCSQGVIDKSVLGLAEVRRMPWLRHVSTLDLYGGLGEPLLLKDFPDIVEWLRGQNGGQALHVTTNGMCLTPEISRRLHIFPGIPHSVA